MRYILLLLNTSPVILYYAAQVFRFFYFFQGLFIYCNVETFFPLLWRSHHFIIININIILSIFTSIHWFFSYYYFFIVIFAFLEYIHTYCMVIVTGSIFALLPSYLHNTWYSPFAHIQVRNFLLFFSPSVCFGWLYQMFFPNNKTNA